MTADRDGDKSHIREAQPMPDLSFTQRQGRFPFAVSPYGLERTGHEPQAPQRKKQQKPLAEAWGRHSGHVLIGSGGRLHGPQRYPPRFTLISNKSFMLVRWKE